MNSTNQRTRFLRFALAIATTITIQACGDDSAQAPATNDVANDITEITDSVTGDSQPPAAIIPDITIAPVDLEPAPDARLGATSIFRLSDQQRITYADLPDPGTANRPVVMLHDFGSASSHWTAVARMINQNARVIAPDLRGHGNSSEPDCCYRATDFASDTLALLDELNIAEFELIGSGGGALIAQQIAASHPQRVARLVLIGADTTASNNETYRALQIEAQNFGPAGPSDDFLARWNLVGSTPEANQSARLDSILAAQRNTSSQVWAQALDAFVREAPDLTTLAIPTLLLAGDQDSIMGPGVQQTFGQRLRSEVTLSDPGSGRYPSVDRPITTATTISRFLSRRGTLHASALISERSRQSIDDLSDGFVERIVLRELTGVPDCSVRFYQIQYQTVGAAGESTLASAGVFLPTGPASVCNGERPAVLYAHGTSARKNYNALTATETSLIAMAVFAARGYIVVAPNYTGYAESWLNYHPYLNAQAQSQDMVDAWRATGAMLTQLPEISSGELFLTGYSQGGYVAMATHREIERNHQGEITIAGSFPMSGPYALDATVAQVLGGRVSDGASQLFPLFAEGFQRAYGNVYQQSSDIFNPPYDATAIGLFPGTLGASDALAQGLLPGRIIARQGNPHLLRQTFVDDVLTNPTNGLIQALQRNSLIFDWVPQAPMELCGGGKDKTVFFDNTTRARDAFASRGQTPKIWDFNNRRTFPNGSRNTLYRNFRLLFLFGNDDAYHAALAPYCATLAREFFNRTRLR